MSEMVRAYLQGLCRDEPDLAVHLPVVSAAGIAVTPFGPAATEAAAPTFVPGWRFTSPAPLVARAMVLGELRWSPASGSAPAAAVLQNANWITLAASEVSATAPPWLPPLAYLRYEGLDLSSVEVALATYLNGLATTEMNALRERIRSGTPGAGALPLSDGAEIAGYFTGRTTLGGTRVEFGVLVRPGQTIGTAPAVLTVSGRTDDELLINPAYLAHALAAEGLLDVGGADDVLVAAVTSLDAPMTANPMGTIHTVSAAGADFLRISQAVAAAQPGDTIWVTANETYTETSEIVLDKPVNIIGAAPIGATPLGGERDTLDADGAPVVTVPPELPLFDGNESHRAFRIAVDPAGYPTGTVFLGRLHITDCWDSTATPSTNHVLTGGGGAIRIEKTHPVILSNLLLENNRARAGSVGGPEGYGGAVQCWHSSTLLYGCCFRNNQGNGRGGALGVYGYGYPVLVANLFRSNKCTKLSEANARLDGGAIAVATCTPKLEFQTDGEIKDDIGATIGVTRAEMDALQLLMKQLKDGDLLDSEGALGRLWDVVETAKKFAAYDLSDQFDVPKIGEAEQSRLSLVNNWFEDNVADDDGGALYLSVHTAVYGRNNVLRNNRAGSNGGGIRITYGSEFVLEGSRIEGCESNHLKVAQIPTLVGGGMREKKDSGGGISARNCRLVLQDCEVVGNTAHGFAGGGIFFNSSDEGMEFHDTMHEAFRFTAPELAVRGGRIANNRATKLSDQASDHGKGGGIYVLRYKADYLNATVSSALNASAPQLFRYVAFRADPLKVTLDHVEMMANQGHVSEPAGTQLASGDDHLFFSEMIDGQTFTDTDLDTAAGHSSFSYISVNAA